MSLPRTQPRHSLSCLACPVLAVQGRASWGGAFWSLMQIREATPRRGWDQPAPLHPSSSEALELDPHSAD